ncbi:MAG: CYTH domain-containing protein [Bacteroidota bacterium]|nr:CYTH domain-containing protein [Bacteroidota bacterium]
MALEIERKFLVKGKFAHLSVKEQNITQAYLSVDPERIIRVRISNGRALLSVKSGIRKTGFTRNEWELEIPLKTAAEILEICLPGRIDKTRYIVPYMDHTWEVDVFHGKNEGLIIAEIELTSENENFEKPEWLGEEVTGRSEYYNSNLI